MENSWLYIGHSRFFILAVVRVQHRMVEETGEKTKTYFHMK